MADIVQNPSEAASIRKDHWDRVYSGRGEGDVSWFQAAPTPSLECFDWVDAKPDWAVIDVGGGASRLVDHLIAKGYEDLTVLDLSEAALAMARARLGGCAGKVRWIAGDATLWTPSRRYDLWHDRAAFHFLTERDEQDAYIARLRKGLRARGYFVVATFAADGPEKCSGLPVVRYDAERLSERLGSDFALVHHRAHVHATPWLKEQRFQFSVFRLEQ